jgi:hypothetical protein
MIRFLTYLFLILLSFSSLGFAQEAKLGGGQSVLRYAKDLSLYREIKRDLSTGKVTLVPYSLQRTEDGKLRWVEKNRVRLRRNNQAFEMSIKDWDDQSKHTNAELNITKTENGSRTYFSHPFQEGRQDLILEIPQTRATNNIVLCDPRLKRHAEFRTDLRSIFFAKTKDLKHDKKVVMKNRYNAIIGYELRKIRELKLFESANTPQQRMAAVNKLLDHLQTLKPELASDILVVLTTYGEFRGNHGHRTIPHLGGAFLSFYNRGQDTRFSNQKIADRFGNRGDWLKTYPGRSVLTKGAYSSLNPSDPNLKAILEADFASNKTLQDITENYAAFKAGLYEWEGEGLEKLNHYYSPGAAGAYPPSWTKSQDMEAVDLDKVRIWRSDKPKPSEAAQKLNPDHFKGYIWKSSS